MVMLRQKSEQQVSLPLNALVMHPKHVGHLSSEIVLSQKSQNCTLLRSRKGDALT